MKKPCKALVCFAVMAEMAYFRRHILPKGFLPVITGMGRAAARKTLLRALERRNPELVMSCGFAGGLDPALPLNALVYNENAPTQYTSILQNAGARPVRFHCSKRVAVTANEKATLFRETQCGAVEMESAELEDVCRELGIPFIVLRAISDTAHENMVLDFNRFMTASGQTHLGKLILHVLRHPSLIPKLLRFDGQVRAAAFELGPAIEKTLIGIFGESARASRR